MEIIITGIFAFKAIIALLLISTVASILVESLRSYDDVKLSGHSPEIHQMLVVALVLTLIMVLLVGVQIVALDLSTKMTLSFG